MAVTVPFEAFVKKQAIADAIVNIVLAGGINYALSRNMEAVPLVLPFGNTAPNLCGTILSTSVLMSILLTIIVFPITVAQRKSGKVDPGLPADTRYAGVMWRLVAKHLLFTLPPAIGLSVLAGMVAPNLNFSPPVFAALTVVIAATMAWFMSQSTTRATMRLG